MKRLALALVVLATACASPEVDRVAPGFDTQVYSIDLDACRGGTDSVAALESFEAFLQGTLIGTYYGLLSGTASGDAAEGMAVGAVIGAVVGLGVGGTKTLHDRNAVVTNCLRRKGYTIVADQGVPKNAPGAASP